MSGERNYAGFIQFEQFLEKLAYFVDFILKNADISRKYDDIIQYQNVFLMLKVKRRYLPNFRVIG